MIEESREELSEPQEADGATPEAPEADVEPQEAGEVTAGEMAAALDAVRASSGELAQALDAAGIKPDQLAEAHDAAIRDTSNGQG